MRQEHRRTATLAAPRPADVLLVDSGADAIAHIAAALRQDGRRVLLCQPAEAVAHVRARRASLVLMEAPAGVPGEPTAGAASDLARACAAVGARLLLVSLPTEAYAAAARGSVGDEDERLGGTQEARAQEGSVSALQASLHQMERARADHDRFIAMVAHELSGPLSPILNYAQLARRPTATPADVTRYLNLIEEQAWRLSRLVADLSAVTRMDAGQFALLPRRCDVAALVRAVVEQFALANRARRFETRLPSAPLWAEVDADRVTQALGNLLDNAIKYSVEEGTIEVSVWCEAQMIHVSVGDYGAGISADEMARIFDPFARLARTREVAGSGLGLYITRGIITAHGGALTVRNREGEHRAGGAIFSFTLPTGDTGSDTGG